MRVPLLDLKLQNDALRPQIDEALGRVLDSNGFILGSEVAALEEELAEYCGAKYAIGCASGSDAILLALMALDVGPGDEVITKAIEPVHLYGQCADMRALMGIGERHGIPIVEDAAQAIGAEENGRRAGSIGAIGCFSFYPSKNLGGMGDGGFVTTNDDALAKKLQAFRVHGAEE